MIKNRDAQSGVFFVARPNRFLEPVRSVFFRQLKQTAVTKTGKFRTFYQQDQIQHNDFVILKTKMTQKELQQIVNDIETYGLIQFRKYDDYLIDNLIENKITFSSAQDFNDPFDCNLPINIECSRFDLQILLFRIVSPRNTNDLAYISRRCEELFINQSDLKKFLKSQIHDHRRFTCFNVPKANYHLENSLFWANYAYKHQGICMKFSKNLVKHYTSTFNPQIQFIPIEYCKDDNIPDFNYIKHRVYNGSPLDLENKATQYFYGTKSKEWSHENEIRFVYYDGKKIDHQYINVEFPTRDLEQIYIGCKITEDEKDVILKCLSDKKYDHVNIYQLELDDKQFKLKDRLIKQGKKL